ncbi:hypothetical protein BASA60_007485 [Batrachochytrium salamandrivorans]|nr:hypothetical protein BASA60_007485 [Batrachochytrium salamandrivorans]
MDSSHSDCYRQTVYHSNLDVLAASAISDAVDCLKCPTALLQLCDIALDDGPLLLPAWPLKGVNIEHFPTPVHLTSNIPPALRLPLPTWPLQHPAATAKQRSTAARSKKAASIKRRRVVNSTDLSFCHCKKPANTLATAGDTMLTDDELKVMAYIVSSLQVVRPV